MSKPLSAKTRNINNLIDNRDEGRNSFNMQVDDHNSNYCLEDATFPA